RSATGDKQAYLPRDQIRKFGIILGGSQQFFWEFRCAGIRQFSLQSATAGENFEILAFDDSEFGQQQCAVKAQQNLSGIDCVAFVDRDFLHNAAIRMLDDLTLLLNLDLTRRDDRTRDTALRGPDAETDE